MSFPAWAMLGLAAQAADQSDGVALPGATPLQTTASIGVGVGGFGTFFWGTLAAFALEGSLRVSDRWSVLGGGALVRYRDDADTPDQVHTLVSLRFFAVSNEFVRVAPMLTAVVGAARPNKGSLGLGLAMEGGSEKVRGDLSVPSLVGLRAGFGGEGREEYGLYPGFLGAGLEVGTTLRLGEHHELRAGLPSVLTWRVRSDHLYFETSCTFLLVAALGTLEVGARF